MAVAEFVLPNARSFARSSPIRWILSHLNLHWMPVAMMLIGAIGNAVLAGAVPVLFGQAFDLLQSNPGDIPGLIQLAWWVLISQLVRSVLQFWRNFSAEVIAQRMERDIRDELYQSLLGKSMTFHNLQPVGDTMARATNDVREINLMFSPGINLVVGSGSFMIVPLLAAPSYHPALMLTPALFIVAYLLSLWQYLNELRPISERVRQTFGEMNSRLAEAIDGIEVVKGSAQEEEEISRFTSHALQFRHAFVHQGDVEARYIPLLLLGLAIAGSFLHAVLLFQQGLIGAGDVVAYVGLISLFGFPTFVSIFAYSQVSLGLAGARRILELMNRRTELDRNPQGNSESMRGEIEFRNVCFAYPDGVDVLRDVSFHVKPGTTIALVGQTGSGKTTLAKLINRIHDATTGEVLVDGVNVRDWNLDTLRRQISIIEQDVFLFSRTIGENIAFGKPAAEEGEVSTSAAAAQANEFIDSFKDGYQTLVGERGVTLSGGQRQRVALARAFLTDPRILILDDATSAIDSATEDQIQRAIFRAAEGRTTLIITHRLSQIRWADLILVLRNGKVAAVGTHEELMATSESYRRIFQRD